MHQTEQLCEFVERTGYDDLPQDAIETGKRMILDTLGCALGGIESDAATTALNTAALNYQEEDKCRIVGTSRSTRAKDAAFVFGIASHVLDYDDVHHGMGGHPSVPILSTIIPLGEEIGATGEEILSALILGAEAEITLADVMNPGHYEAGWHPTSVLGTIGASLAAGKLLDLDRSELRRAVGIAASHASGIKANFGTMTKPYHVGNAARGGIEAAELASQGYTANESVLEADFGGFCGLFEGDHPHSFDNHLERLGSPWGILSPPVGFKPYPCCRASHAAIDAVLHLREQHQLAPGDIESMTVTQHPSRLDHTDRPNPQDVLDAKFSIQYLLSVALEAGDVRLGHFDGTAITSREFRRHIDKVSIRKDAELFDGAEYGATVQITGGANERYTRRVDNPRGSGENPLAQDELHAKYRECATRVLPEPQISASLYLVSDLENLDDISPLIDELTLAE